MTLLISRLEQYTLKYPQEVLLLQADIAGEPDQIVIFRGFSSSLMRPTAFDPEIPTLPPEASVIQIDRLKGPYRPEAPQYIEQGLSLATFTERLKDAGL